MTKILPDYCYHSKKAKYGKINTSNDVFMVVLHGELEEEVGFDRANLVEGSIIPEMNKWVDVHCIGIRQKCQGYFWKNPSGKVLGLCTYKGQESVELARIIKESFLDW